MFSATLLEILRAVVAVTVSVLEIVSFGVGDSPSAILRATIAES